MWIWHECEDVDAALGGADIVDDWGAAAHRYMEVPPGAICVYQPGAYTVYHVDEDEEETGQWTLSLRYRRREEGSGRLRVLCNGTECELELPQTGGRRWAWASMELGPIGESTGITLQSVESSNKIDGFFLHDRPIELPDDVRKLDPILGESEAEEAEQDYMHEIEVPEGVTAHFYPEPGFPSDIAKEAAGDLWPVLEDLAQKPCPYIINAYDVGKGTDYNSDYSWHSLDKEKRWELPYSGALGLVNPNSDVSYVIGFAFDTSAVSYDWRFKPVLHLADILAYEVDLGPDLRCEVTFRCHSSDTVIATVHIENEGGEDRRVVVGELLAKDRRENPPSQRYVLPGQRHGAGVTTTAGGLAWTGVNPEGKAVAACFYEWIRGRSRGRRLLSTLVSAQLGDRYRLDPSKEERGVPPHGAILGLKHPIVVPAGRTAIVALSLNMRRFTLYDDWNPEITPELYLEESEEAAEEEGYLACVEAISENIEGSVRTSIEPYRSFPKVTLPEKSWEADFYAALEIPRASTFSALGNLETPFYNFCRVHAHEPFGWWSYGMHAHEDLCTLFTNITAPRLSATFLLGHIRHQQEDGMYPYGVSHTINPRLKTREATAPLILWEAWKSYLWSGDREFLEEAYNSGKENQAWWLENRDRMGEGLCHWLNTSGESVRDDDDLPTWQVTGGSQYQEALDLNCYLLVQERTLAAMARELGKLEEAEAHEKSAERLAKAINAHMWHEGDRCYYGIGEVVPSWANVRDISTFFPLWAGLAPEGRFEPLVAMIDDPNSFNLPYGPPSYAKDEPCFGPQWHWHGSNWVEMSLFPILGLKEYGCYKRAADLAYQNTKMVFDELERYGHFREYFNSIEGNGTDLIDYIWTPMPAYFIVGIFFGIEPQSEGLSVMPALPDGWKDMQIENLRVRDKVISVKVTVDTNASHTTVKVNGDEVEAKGGRGAFIPWDRLESDTWIDIVQPPSIAEEHAPPAPVPDWSDVPPHAYPDDPELVETVRRRMKSKEELREAEKRGV